VIGGPNARVLPHLPLIIPLSRLDNRRSQDAAQKKLLPGLHHDDEISSATLPVISAFLSHPQTTIFLLSMANVAAIQKLFLSSPYYAVVGASKDQSKFGTKVYFNPPQAW
jgi:hypothetical protein